MKISQVSFSRLGGAGKVAGQLSEELEKLGHESRFTVFSESNLRSSPMSKPMTTLLAGLDELIIKNGKFDFQFSLLRDFMRGAEGLSRALDIVNFHWVTGLVSFSEMEKLAEGGVRLFWTLHDMRPFTGACHHSGQCSQYMSSCKNCPQAHGVFRGLVEHNLVTKLRYRFPSDLTVIAPSEWMSKAARNSALFRKSKIVVIPNPINPVFFSKKKVPEENPPQSNSVVFSVIAADLKDPNKRVAQVCEALRLLSEIFKGIDIRLLLIGSRGEHFAEKYPFVSLLGTLNPGQLSQTLDSVDVNISFSVLETSPLTIAECAARGVPTIASLNPGSAELISNLDCGTTVGDMKEFMSALESVVKNKLNSGAPGLAGNQMSTNAEKLHSPEKVALSYLEQYLS